MALQVWLPLTKDLRQQGLSNVTVTNNGATYSSTGGKLGGCYSFSNNTMVLPSFNTTRSISLWLKTTLTNSTIAFVDYKSKLGFGFQSNGYIIANCSNTSFKMFSNTNFQSGQWNHIVVIRDDALTDVTLYINGVLQTERINTTNTWTNNVDGCYLGGRSTGTNMTCSINDFRVYDYCLSPMEVKELAKGLVLHYPLNRNGWGQENLVVNSHIEQSGINTYKFYAFGSNNNLVAGDSCTVSFDIKSTINNVACDVYFRSSNGMVGSSKILTGITTEYKRFSTTMTVPSSTYVSMAVRWNGNVSGANTSATYYIRNMKVEKGSIATPWCPNLADELAAIMGLNSTTEYDCSGFCNNGTKMTDTITYTSDTAKYQVSNHFNGTYDGIIIENLALKDIINSAVTYAFWIKPESESGARSVYFGSYNTGPSWSIEKTTGNVMRSYWNGSPDETCSGATITDGVWQHICLTKNGTNDIKIYINGIQKWASTATHSNLNFPTTYRIGRDTRSNDGTPYKGLMSDFRIYATALSADDVKSLYQNSAYIDSSGNVYGTIHEV